MSPVLLLAIKRAVERVREFLGWRYGRSQDNSWAAEGVIRSDGQENRGLREERPQWGKVEPADSVMERNV